MKKKKQRLQEAARYQKGALDKFVVEESPINSKKSNSKC
jgi:hypothetical protein